MERDGSSQSPDLIFQYLARLNAMACGGTELNQGVATLVSFERTGIAYS